MIFWYTRNGHGVGYWDRDQLSRYVDIGGGTEGDLGDSLSEAARDFGNVDASFGEDESSPTGYGFVYVQ